MKGFKYVITPVIAFVYIVLGGFWDQKNKNLPVRDSKIYANVSNYSKLLGNVATSMLVFGSITFTISILGMNLSPGGSSIYVECSLIFLGSGVVLTVITALMMK